MTATPIGMVMDVLGQKRIKLANQLQNAQVITIAAGANNFVTTSKRLTPLTKKSNCGNTTCQHIFPIAALLQHVLMQLLINSTGISTLLTKC